MLKEYKFQDQNGGGNYVNGGGAGCGEDEDGPIDFVLAWDGRDEVASAAEAASKRRVFESNLRKEGLVVESLGRNSIDIFELLKALLWSMDLLLSDQIGHA